MRRLSRIPWLTGYFLLLTTALLVPADREWHAHRQPVWLALGTDLTATALLADALVNVGIFLPLGILLHRRWSGHRRSARPALRAIILVASFSLAIETAQYLLGWRESSIVDVVSDTLGAALGWGLAAYRRRADLVSLRAQPRESARRAA